MEGPDKVAAALGPTSASVRTRDGFLVSSHHAGDAVIVVPLDPRTAAAEDIAGAPDGFARANRELAPAATVIAVRPGAAAGAVLVVHEVAADDAAVFPRTRIEAAPASEVTVIEMWAGAGRSLVLPVTEIDVAAGARVSYVHLQLLGPAVWQIGLQASRVAAGAQLVSAAIALGGDYARLRNDSALTGAGASTRLLAGYFAAGEQMHDFRTVQDHRAAKTTSDLLFKGVVANRSRSVYSGLIRVEKGARGTNAFQTNRNLVLHEGAHADSVPNLEIEDNDVRCSHASAVGPVSEDERFYLESRGVPTEEASRLIALGFLDEVIGQVPAPALAPLLREVLAAKLGAAERAEARS